MNPDDFLSTMLAFAVPLHLEEIKARGGPTDCQIAWSISRTSQAHGGGRSDCSQARR